MIFMEKKLKKIIKYQCEYCGRLFNKPQNIIYHKTLKHHEQYMNEPAQIHHSPDRIDISRKQLQEKRAAHSQRCDVCGKTETVITNPSKTNKPNQLCVDHDHNNKRFRGFLCVQCNRNFGWYDKYKDKIHEHENFEHA